MQIDTFWQPYGLLEALGEAAASARSDCEILIQFKILASYVWGHGRGYRIRDIPCMESLHPCIYVYIYIYIYVTALP